MRFGTDVRERAVIVVVVTQLIAAATASSHRASRRLLDRCCRVPVAQAAVASPDRR
ncbi:hypothetical protein [Reyranella sp.]|uniref:hypothetical protein n=1 Tax=Reyranella sp. TaxID=1929291 RepID=UPI002F949813